MAQALSAASVKTPVKKVSAKAKKAPVKATKSNIGTLVPKPTVTGKGASRKQYKYTGKYPENVDKTTPQIVGLVDTVESAEKGELDSSSFTAQSEYCPCSVTQRGI